MPHSSFRFRRALTRPPIQNVAPDEPSASPLAPGCAELGLAHSALEKALDSAGVNVLHAENIPQARKPAPIGDMGICLGGHPILLRPGDPGREAERMAVLANLDRLCGPAFELPGPGLLCGSDIVVTCQDVIVGRSRQTDRIGAERLRPIVEDLGHNWRFVETPCEVTALSNACAVLDEETFLVAHGCSASEPDSTYRLVECPPDEGAATWVLRVNDTVLVGSTLTQTQDLLSAAGYHITPVDISACQPLGIGLARLFIRLPDPEA